ncbi:hypothetical protein BGZ60DRAFT_527756 [Tricladium varicosporioides]|nr:hypothetical protein BGZ60DRAFT_527756 [Hymenoscyphus varicosporioides]
MDNGSPGSTSTSTSTSISGSTATHSTSSTSDGAIRAKPGPKSKWSLSRQRKLTRLYLYTDILAQDIPKALKEGNWKPGGVSTTHTTAALLDHEPRWLRPKERAEMDKRILALTECKNQRQSRRKPSRVEGWETFEPFIDASAMAFSETPLDDIAELAAQEPLKLARNAPQHQELDARRDSLVDKQSPRPDPFALQLNPLPLAGLSNSDEHEDQDADLSEISISSLRRRLSSYSTEYVKAIATLLQAHSISDSSAASSAWPSLSASMYTADESDEATIRSASLEPSPRKKRPTLANSFLTLDIHIQRQGVCLPGLKAHDLKTCWCAVAEETSDKGVWVSGSKILFSPWFLLEKCHPRRFFPDKFGNNILHMLAVRDVDMTSIFKVLELGVDGNEKNTANQSFLHVLPRGSLQALRENDWNGLMVNLQRLSKYYIRFHECDLFGRNFFHLLTRNGNILGRNELQVFNFLRIRFPRTRDAFGHIPRVQTEGDFDLDISFPQNPIHDPSSPSSSSESLQLSPSSAGRPMVERRAASLFSNDGSTKSAEESTFILKHTRLIEIARIAFDVPTIEDPEGRNGLHCLAEASLSLSIDAYTLHSNPPQKRKRGQSDPHKSLRLQLRFELIQQLIYNGVELNGYDKEGNTVLMAFVTHLCDGENQKDRQTIFQIFRHIISSGANIHWRNRDGETALHIAIRLGCKIATQVLLESGANVHARTLDGKGVLAVGEVHYFRAKDNPPLYSSILACMALAAQYGAQAAPSLVQEWLLPGRSPSSSYPFE